MKKLESTWYNMMIVLTLIAVCAGAALAYVNHLTEGPIKEIAEANEVYDFVMDDRNKLAEIDKPFYTVSIKADQNSPMGTITDVKQMLRKGYALKIVYSATKPRD